MKAICENAGVTTGALYKRYKGKEDLFCAVVADTVAALYDFVARQSAAAPADLPDNGLVEAWEMGESMTAKSYEYYLEAKKRGLTQADISSVEMHILLSAFWTTVYEPFIHGYTWEQIESHCELICRLFNWSHVLGFDAAK